MQFTGGKMYIVVVVVFCRQGGREYIKYCTREVVSKWGNTTLGSVHLCLRV